MLTGCVMRDAEQGGVALTGDGAVPCGVGMYGGPCGNASTWYSGASYASRSTSISRARAAPSCSVLIPSRLASVAEP